MFPVKQTDKEPERGIRTSSPTKSVNKILQGTPSQPFGSYDFLILLICFPIWITFTGLLLLFKRRIDKRWWDVVLSGDYRSMSKKVKKKTSGKGSVKIVDIKPKDQTNILAN